MPLSPPIADPKDSYAQARRLSIAPMMEWTDRHDRFFLRLISRHCLLFTEMVTAQALVHGDAERLLAHDAREYPLTCQLGDSDPALLAKAAQITRQFGYREINLNVGCPSERVQSGSFGACLMDDPTLVGECLAAMQEAAGPDTIISAKCRIGINERDDYPFLQRFIATIAAAGCRHVTIHARVAILKGLSPKENRDIPPLQYGHARQIKADFPDLHISINGGITSLAEALFLLGAGQQPTPAHPALDGVMIGRAAYHNPYILAHADRWIFGDSTAPIPTRAEIITQLLPYMAAEYDKATPLHHITRHILGLFNGLPGARQWRRALSDYSKGQSLHPTDVEKALATLPEESRQSRLPDGLDQLLTQHNPANPAITAILAEAARSMAGRDRLAAQFLAAHEATRQSA